MSAPRRILVVDDEPDMVELVVDALEARGWIARGATSGERALELAEGAAVVVTDINMPGMSGLELCRALKERAPEVPVILMTAYGSIQSAVEALKEGAWDFLTKPLEMGALIAAVERALSHQGLKDEVARLKRAAHTASDKHGMVGDSRAMRNLYQTLERVGPVDSSVLLVGETGTGKELAAKALHALSERRGAPFVSVNLSAVPEHLLESQFFGHEEGAFTGANVRFTGLLRAADQGTLFLDEVGDMPATLQPKLLRALQERRVLPVGGTSEVPFDVRVIAATHRDLHAAVRDGRFREDLYYRLNVIHVELPPLRVREGDVARLALRFVDKYVARNKREPMRVDDDALRALEADPWPGNVRELENVIERAVALARSDTLRTDDLPGRFRAQTRKARASAAPNDEVELVALEEIERRHILAVLDALDGNKVAAAKVLGLDRRTLYRRLERYGR